jgi:hypothetical protein
MGTPAIATGRNTFSRPSFARTRNGVLLIVTGTERGLRWDGITSQAESLGIDQAPSVMTLADDTGGGNVSAEQTYYAGYRYLDDADIPGSLCEDLATITTSADALHRIDYAGIAANSDPRVVKIEIYRSTAGQQTSLYRVAVTGNRGEITATADSGGFAQFTTSATHYLELGTVLEVTGHPDAAMNTQHRVTAVDAVAKTFVTDQAYSSGGAASWATVGFQDDETADTTLATYPRIDIFFEDDTIDARRYSPAPNWASAVVMFQDRAWYAVPVRYDQGTVTTNGTVDVVGSGTEWTSAMVGRQISITGETKPYTIASVGTPTTLTLNESAATSDGSLSYSIYPDPIFNNSVVFSPVDEPESVTEWINPQLQRKIVNIVILQENTGDDDWITAIMPHGLFLFVFMERHTSRITFNRQPELDAHPSPLNSRGCLNQHCWDKLGDMAYVLDQYGPYRIGVTGSAVDPIGMPIADLWRDATINLNASATKWYTVAADPSLGVVRFFVKYLSDTGTRPTRAFVFHVESKSWWEEEYPFEIGGACLSLLAGTMRLLVGAENEAIYQTYSGSTDDGEPIAYNWKTGLLPLMQGAEVQRQVELVYTPTVGAATVNARLYMNHETTPRNFEVDENLGNGVTVEGGSPNMVIDLQDTQNSQQTDPGYKQFTFGGRLDHDSYGAPRWVSLELTGEQATGLVKFHTIAVTGAGG